MKRYFLGGGLLGDFIGVSALGGAIGLLTGWSLVIGASGIGYSDCMGGTGRDGGVLGRVGFLNRFFTIPPD